MTQTNSPALQIALAYYHAWSGRNIDTAMSYIADDIVCDAPTGRLEGTVAFRQSEVGFASILTGSTLIAAFGNDETALLFYNTHTLSVKSIPTAKYFTVKNGKITSIRIVFDQTLFASSQGG